MRVETEAVAVNRAITSQIEEAMKRHQIVYKSLPLYRRIVFENIYVSLSTLEITARVFAGQPPNQPRVDKTLTRPEVPESGPT